MEFNIYTLKGSRPYEQKEAILYVKLPTVHIYPKSNLLQKQY